MTHFPYTLVEDRPEPLGLIVLSTDETIEMDFRRLLPQAQLYISRVPSADAVSAQSLRAMAGHISEASDLLPKAQDLAALGYGCTSATAQIGQTRLAQLLRAGAIARGVTDPITGLQAACAHLGLKSLAFLSPYVETVSAPLRGVLAEGGVGTPVFGSFEEAEEAKVVRISGPSLRAAALELCAEQHVDGVFLSCTNLRTLDVIEPLEDALDVPVLSSNLVLAWHMAQLSGQRAQGPGRLLASG